MGNVTVPYAVRGEIDRSAARVSCRAEFRGATIENWLIANSGFPLPACHLPSRLTREWKGVRRKSKTSAL